MKLRLSLAFVVLLAGFAGVQAQDVVLDWRFDKEQEFYQKMVSETNQKMTIGGQPVTQNNKQEFVFKWTVKDKSEDGNTVELEQRIMSVSVTIKMGNTTIQYNSLTPPAADNPLANYFKPLVGAAFTIKLKKTADKGWKVDSVGGREEFVRKLTDANPAMAQVLRAILSDEQLKQMAEPAFAVVPAKATKVGEEWTREAKLNMGAIGTYDATYKYKYEGTVEKEIDNQKTTLHKISLTPTLVYRAPTAEAAGGLQFKIESGVLETKDTSGTILFDLTKGWVKETTMSVKLKGQLKVTVSDSSATVDIEQSQETTTTTYTKNPNG